MFTVIVWRKQWKTWLQHIRRRTQGVSRYSPTTRALRHFNNRRAEGDIEIAEASYSFANKDMNSELMGDEIDQKTFAGGPRVCLENARA
jgi:hypothetical protein